MDAAPLPGLLEEVGLPSRLAERVVITGEERPFDTSIPIVECAASALGAIGAAVCHLWELSTGREQEVAVSRGHAGASLVGFAFQDLEGAATPEAPFARDRPLVKLYRCGDGRWVHLQGQFPHMAERACAVLGCPVDSSTEVVAARVARWDGKDLEDALAEADACGVMARSVEEWATLPQGAAIEPLGRVSIEKIGDSPPEPAQHPLPPQGQHRGPRLPILPRRPLEGLRVLDLSRLLAGPTNGRTLAEHGAEVLLVNSERLTNIPAFVMDTSHGKRSCCLELEDPAGFAALRALAADADVFTQGYRGGSLERRGLGAEALAELRPGIVVVTMNCYGDVGPWRSRPGWEQMAQTASGMAVEHGSLDHPVLVPAAACDYTTGYLGALGTLAALARRATEGGSYHVRVSLCQTANWFTHASRWRSSTSASASTSATRPLRQPLAASFGDVDAYLTTSATPYGRLRHLAPVVQMSETPAHWEIPTSPIGSHAPAWQQGSSRI